MSFAMRLDGLAPIRSLVPQQNDWSHAVFVLLAVPSSDSDF